MSVLRAVSATTRQVTSYIRRDRSCTVDPATLQPGSQHTLVPLVAGIRDSSLIRVDAHLHITGSEHSTVTALDVTQGELNRLPEANRY